MGRTPTNGTLVWHTVATRWAGRYQRDATVEAAALALAAVHLRGACAVCSSHAKARACTVRKHPFVCSSRDPFCTHTVFDSTRACLPLRPCVRDSPRVHTTAALVMRPPRAPWQRVQGCELSSPPTVSPIAYTRVLALCLFLNIPWIAFLGLLLTKTASRRRGIAIAVLAYGWIAATDARQSAIKSTRARSRFK